MTTEHKVARRKLSLLELATELNSVSRACQIVGYSRQQFYEIRRNFQTYGAEATNGSTDAPVGLKQIKKQKEEDKMHACYLRVSGVCFDVDDFTSSSKLASDSENLTKWRKGEPFRRDVRQDSGFLLEICEVKSEGLEEQTVKAINFLRNNFEELKHLMEQPHIQDAYLQFVIDKRNVANQNDLFPADLVRLSGSLGLGILLSQYA